MGKEEESRKGNRRAAAMSILFVAVPSTLAALVSLYFALTDRMMAALTFGIALGFPLIALWLHELNRLRTQRERHRANGQHQLPPKRCPGPVMEAKPAIQPAQDAEDAARWKFALEYGFPERNLDAASPNCSWCAFSTADEHYGATPREAIDAARAAQRARG